MPQLSELETPFLVLERSKLERNCQRMRDKMKTLGVALRPHVKTCKSMEVARIALGGEEGGITVSTLKEAEQFFAAGIRDILYAVCIAPNKLDHAADLRRRGADLKILVDSVAAARMVAGKAAGLGMTLPTLIEIDSDGHRSGVQPEDPALLEIGRALGANLAGVLTHAGDSYKCSTVDAIRSMAEQERAAVVGCAEKLRAAGMSCPIVSVGSSPTATYAENLSGVTEVRAGVYVFFDLFMTGLGVCSIDDIALSVLTTVIGHQPRKGWIITDAGWMAMSRDRGTARQKVDQGYGVVCDFEGRPLDNLIMADANQEHGILTTRDGSALDMADFPIGRLLRILPNHACATAAQHPAYQVVEGGPEVAAVWPRFAGW